MVTAAQLGHHAKPCVLVDVAGYYAPLVAWVDGAIAAGLIAAPYRALLAAYPSPDAALAALAAAVQR